MTTTKTALYDALTLEIERADALSLHIESRLSTLSDDATNAPELYALSIIAREVCEVHQRILERALELHESRARRRQPDPGRAAKGTIGYRRAAIAAVPNKGGAA